MIFQSKKSQLAVFIILGILFLAAAAVTIVYYNATIKEKDIEAVMALEMPEWVKPVKEYVDSCIKAKSIEAFKKLGAHGGYIDPYDAQLSGFSFNLDRNSPTESDAAFLADTTPIVYWWYLQTDNLCSECRVSSLMPSIEHIQRQVDVYVNRNLQECTDRFASFKEAGFEIQEGKPGATARVNRDDVSIGVRYPLTIRKENALYEMSDFSINLDLDFQHVYDVAVLTMIEEINNLSLEDITLGLFSVYSAPDADKIPPISWIDSRKTFATWPKDKVEDRIRNEILAPNINIIQVDKTKDAKPIEASGSVVQGFYKSLYLSYLPFEYPSLSMRFLYDPGWKIFFDITPRSGSTIQPRVIRQSFPSNFAPPEQTNYYEFFYDISYPVIAVIRDEASLLSEAEHGYTFMFALEANIRDNKDLHEWNQGRGTLGYYDPNSVSVTFKSSEPSLGRCTQSGAAWSCPLNGKSYADNITCNFACTTSTAKTSRPRIPETLLCNANQRIGANLTLALSDAKQNPIPDVSITYTCGNYRSCTIGSTDADGKFAGKLPVCIGQGILKLEKDGVIARTVMLESRPDETKAVNTLLDTIVEKEVKILASDINGLAQGNFREAARSLLGNEQVTLTVSRVRQSGEDDSIASSLVMDAKNPKQTIRLAPGTYEVRAVLQNLDGTVISTDTTGGAGIAGGSIPSVTIKPVIVGGVEMSSETGYWSVPRNALDAGKAVTFYVYKVFNPSKFDDVARGGDITNITRSYRAQLEPVFS
ncbi:hypothetical protein HYV81_01315 [Candidatus Woesearchaeota archaeon]|nr:hypothetical protein [Candidatus Woesearchaeota archaeon]